MSGKRFFLDTNAVIALLKGDQNILTLLKDAVFVGISIISVIEFFAFPKLSENDQLLFENFLSRIEVDNLYSDIDFAKEVSFFKIEYKLKLPDAVIVCQALENNAVLISNDSDFSSVKNLSILHF